MKTCGNQYHLDNIIQMIGQYYHKCGYNIDIYDKQHNLIIVDYDLCQIDEKENYFTNSNTTFCASGTITLPFKIYSSDKEEITSEMSQS